MIVTILKNIIYDLKKSYKEIKKYERIKTLYKID